MLPSGGFGAASGVARGRVEIDVSQLEAAVRAAQQFGRAFEQALGGVDRGVRQTTTGFRSLVDGISSLRGELLAVSAAAGLLARSGLNGARSLRNYTIAFRQFVGSQEEAVQLVDGLIEQANRYGLEWEGVAQLGRALLPSLKEGTKELDEWVGRAARLRSLFPTAPRGSETIAISEFLAGQNTSLARRFNVPLSVINEAIQKFNDLGDAFDYILEKRGATEAAAVGMADSFVAVRNELNLLLAEGFTPLFQWLQPVLSSFREWISSVRESNPEVATLSAGFIAATAAGTPLLLLFNQLVMAAEKLKQLGVLSSLGRAGQLGLAAGAGIGANTLMQRAIGAATGDEARANTTFWDSLTDFENGVFHLVRWLMEFGIEVRRVTAQFANDVLQASATMLNGAASFVRGIAALLPGGMGGRQMGQVADAVDIMAEMSRAAGRAQMASTEREIAQVQSFMRAWSDRLQGSGGVIRQAAGGSSSFGGATDAGGRTPDQTAAITQWAQSVRQIERQAAEQRLQATQQYEQQRTEMIANYERNIAREAEDFARQRARQAAQLEQQIADIREAAGKREARWLEDLNEKVADVRADRDEKIAELTEDADDRLLELQEKYNRDRERAAEDHRDRLLTAAGRLDAVAVREEQRRYAREGQQAQEAFDERVQSERESLDKRIEQERENAAERIQQEQEAHQERLADAREADAERVQDLRENLAEQQRLEDEDRALRLQRQAEDQARQLEQQAQANAERLAQIDRQAALERQQLDEQFQLQLASLGLYNQAWLEIQRAREQASLQMFDQWWEAVNARFAVQGPAPLPQPQFQPGFLTDFAGGRAPVATFPSSFADASSRAAARSVMFGQGSIQVFAAPGMDEQDLARRVRSELVTVLEEIQ